MVAAHLLLMAILVGGFVYARVEGNTSNWLALGVVLVVLTLAFGAAHGLLLARRLTNGLSQLLDVTERVRGGQRGLRVELDQAGELGRLAEGFNLMLAALETSELRFRELATMSTDWVWEQDDQFRFTMISRSHEQNRALVQRDMLGHCRWELPTVGVSDEEWQKHRALLARHLPLENFTYQVLAANGEVRWFSVSGLPRFDANGVFEGYRGFGSDITERKRAEVEIERQVEQLRARNEELARFNRATVGRELRVVELKRQVNDLSAQLGHAPPYPLEFLSSVDDASASAAVS